MKTFTRSLLVGAAACCLLRAQAEIIYDNSATDEGLFNDSRLESGDEVQLAGTARLLTDFAFEYYAEFNPTGDETARLRFYQMNGAPGDNEFATPGTLLYDSDAFSISSGYHSVSVSQLDVILPSDRFTWTVEFGGLAQNESAGLLYYNPPTVGSSDAYFWQKENGVWLAVAVDGTGNNFAGQATATNATSTIRIANLQVQDGIPSLAVNGATAGKSYALEYKTDLRTGGWTRVPGATTATGASLTLSDSTAPGARYRFYRVLQEN